MNTNIPPPPNVNQALTYKYILNPEANVAFEQDFPAKDIYDPSRTMNTQRFYGVYKYPKSYQNYADIHHGNELFYTDPYLQRRKMDYFSVPQMCTSTIKYPTAGTRTTFQYAKPLGTQVCSLDAWCMGEYKRDYQLLYNAQLNEKFAQDNNCF
jgi:hypothetical protein